VTRPPGEVRREPVLRRRRGPLSALLVIVLVVALIAALAASAGFAGLFSVGTGGSPARSGGPGTAGPATPVQLAHFNEEGLVFDYPADWQVYRYEMVTSFSDLIAYLATVPVRNPCTRTTTSESTTVSCNVVGSYAMEPDSLVVRIERWGNPVISTVLDLDIPGGQLTTVAGLPAIRIDSGTRIEWKLSMPGITNNWYEIHADLQGPDLDRLRAQVEAMVASLRYNPPVVPLPTGEAGEAAMRRAYVEALAGLTEDSLAFSVFPTEPGTSVPCRVTQEPSGPPLRRALDATCSGAIEATPLQLWKMTLTISWPATQRHRAGVSVRTLWVGPDGSIVGGVSSGDPLPDPCAEGGGSPPGR
jgi:hypothetical protein